MYSTSSAGRRFLSRCCVWGLLAGPAAAEAGADERARLEERLGRVEIPFVANTGVHDPEVAFSAPIFAGTAFVTRKGQIVYSLASGAEGSPGWTLTETPVSSDALRPVGEEPSETRVNYFLGDDPARWRTGVETYRSVFVGKPWSGISLQLRAYGNSIEKLFTVAPGADPLLIRMRMNGAKSLRVDRDGSLLIATGLGRVRFTAPIAFQEKGGVRHPVSVRYRVKGSRYGFVLGDYDPGVAVVIDPSLQATYLGGSGGDFPSCLAIHQRSGEVYVAGSTDFSNFPGTAGGAQPIFAGVTDAFVARLNANLTTLAQASYLGGSSVDEGSALAIHPTSGEVYVVGYTASTNFPGTAGGAQPTLGGAGVHPFVARLDASLTNLAQSSYLGGTAGGFGHALAIHPMSGEAYVAGVTASTNFPGTAGGAQPAFGGGVYDGFVARMNASLTTFAQATYLGGSGDTDFVSALAIHPTSGEVYAAGRTDSTDFPGTAGSAQPAFGGGSNDAVVARLNGSLTALTQSSYLGGSSLDEANSLAIHPTSGEVYVAGETASTDFPGTAGGAQPAFGGGLDVFVTRLAANLITLAQASYLGGTFRDAAFALAIHPSSGEVYVGGLASTDFPGTAGGKQPAPGGLGDAFVARLTASLITLAQASYLGGSGADGASDLAIHPTSGEVYVAGYTSSVNFPGTAGGAQPAFGGGEYDGFVARLSTDLAGGTFFTVTPCRVFDTRDPADGPALTSGTERLFQIEGECGVPTSTIAVSANITITGPTAAGFLSIYPSGTPAPFVSTINFRPGQTRANNAIIPLGVAGDIAIIYGTAAPGTVHVIIDVNGYFE